MADPSKPSHFIRDAAWATSRPAGSRGRWSRGSPRNPTATCTSATPRRSASTSAWPRSWAGAATCASTTPTPPRRARSTWTPSRAMSTGSASTGARISTSRATTSASSTTGPCSSSAPGKAYVGRLLGRRDPGAPRHPHRAWAGEPVARPVGGGEPGSLPAHARRRVRGREQGPARQDRYGPSQPQPARPGHVPHPQDRAPPHRGYLVRVPDVRLGARAVRLDRRRHPLAVHARVRGPPPALRLVPGRARCLSPAADRVRALEPQPHRDVASASCSTWSRTAWSAGGTIRACRPWPACGGAATRRVPARLQRAHRGHQGREASSRSRCSSTCLREDLNRRALRRMAVLRPLRLVIELRPTAGPRRWRRPTIPRSERGTPEGLLARALDQAGRLPRDAAAQVLSPFPRRRGAAARPPT